VSEVGVSLGDILDLYCRGVAESVIVDDINVMPTLTSAIVTDVVHAVQQARFNCLTQLHRAMRLISGCLQPIHLSWLPVLGSVVPPSTPP